MTRFLKRDNQSVSYDGEVLSFDEIVNMLNLQDRIMSDLQRVLDAVPECPMHGECIPHAEKWIKQRVESEGAATKKKVQIRFDGGLLNKGQAKADLMHMSFTAYLSRLINCDLEGKSEQMDTAERLGRIERHLGIKAD